MSRRALKRKAVASQSPGTVGEMFKLKVTDFDKRSVAIKRPGAVNPSWKVDNLTLGKLNKNERESVKFTGLAPGICYIRAQQGKADVMTTVEME